MQPSGDSLPGIGETDAAGQIAELCDDIRDTLGTSVVDLTRRSLASTLGGLRTTWETTRPPVPGLTTGILRSVGIDVDDQNVPRADFFGHERGHPLSTIALPAPVRPRPDLNQMPVHIAETDSASTVSLKYLTPKAIGRMIPVVNPSLRMLPVAA